LDKIQKFTEVLENGTSASKLISFRMRQHGWSRRLI